MTSKTPIVRELGKEGKNNLCDHKVPSPKFQQINISSTIYIKGISWIDILKARPMGYDSCSITITITVIPPNNVHTLRLDSVLCTVNCSRICWGHFSLE